MWGWPARIRNSNSVPVRNNSATELNLDRLPFVLTHPRFFFQFFFSRSNHLRRGSTSSVQLPIPSLLPPAPSPHVTTGSGGVEFRRKLHFHSSELHLDPFPLLAANPVLRSAPLPLLRDSLRLLASNGFS